MAPVAFILPSAAMAMDWAAGCSRRRAAVKGVITSGCSKLARA